MAQDSNIQWTHHTFNAWRGCTKVSAGCAHCYAETLSARNPKVLGVWGPHGSRVVAGESTWRDPVRWNKWAAEGTCYHCHGKSKRDTPGKCQICNGTGNIGPYRARVFSASLSDVFEDWEGEMRDAGNSVLFHCARCNSSCWSRDARHCDGCGAEVRLLRMDDIRARLLTLVHQTPHLDWLLLTKRPAGIRPTLERLARRRDDAGDLAQQWLYGAFMPNVWLGASVENQAAADERIPLLLQAPAAIRFLSCEPLLERIFIEPFLYKRDSEARAAGILARGFGVTGDGPEKPPGIDWVIAGGESGAGARPFGIEWARSLRDQCKGAAAFFMKQLGASSFVGLRDENNPSYRGTMETVHRDKKGGDPDEWPEDLRVREFPQAV